jgi:glutamate-1-semialdehyde 2,1-aminomutase
LYFERGEGARVRDVDGNSYVDYGLAWGPLILGHAPPQVVRAVEKCLSTGFTFGAQHDLEFQVAEKLTGIIPCADLVSFANSGTEIVQVALRLARAVTGRPRHVKFEGHYHGWDDSVLVSYHPTAEQMANGGPVPVGKGQRAHTDVLVAQWNDLPGLEAILQRHAGEISAVICEPLLCNTFCLSPEPGFLQGLRRLTAAAGVLLIFDEVITGFRIDLGGAQRFYGVTPDLATYAKAVGGGMPLSVLAGKREYMKLIANGEVVHAGTLNGNPVALAAADASIDILSEDGVYDRLHAVAARLRGGLEREFQAAGLRVITSGEGPVFHVSFMDRPAHTYRDTLAADRGLYTQFAVALLDEGILVLQDGRWYVSTAHDESIVDETLAAVRRVLNGN